MIRLKNIEEIQRIGDAGKILAETYTELEKIVCAGISTREIDQAAHDFVMRRGARPAFLNYRDFPASICTSINEEVIHGIPGSRKLQNGDIIGLDFGVDLKGYIADAAVTLPVGKVNPEAQKLLKVTEECLNLGIAQARCGNRIKHISEAIYNHAKSNNFDVVRKYCGHGVGFEVHEDPQIMNYPGPGGNPRIKKGMVLAIEPMVNQGTHDVEVLEDEWTVVTADSSLSAHFEHTIAVLEDHIRILTTLDEDNEIGY